MSLKSREVGKLALASLAAAAAFGSAASSAQAAKLTLNYQCKYPLIGAQPLKVDIDAAIPATWPTGLATENFAIGATATAGGSTSKAMKLIGAASIEGVAVADATLAGAGSPLPVTVPMTIQTGVKGSGNFADPLVLKAHGYAPELYYDEELTQNITVDKIALNLIARNASGKAIPLKPVATDLDGKPVAQSDSDPATFDVPCKLDPTSQSTKLASIQYKNGLSFPADSSAPSKPGGLKTTSTTASSVSLSWNASTDNVGVTSYEIKRNGATVDFVTGTSATVGGLTGGTAGSYTVTARDRAGNVTASDALSVTTPAGGTDLESIANYNAALVGTATMRTLVSGPIPLNGGIAAQMTTADATYEADLTLNNSTGRLNALGFLPVTAKVGFVSTAKTTGNLSDDGVLTANASLRIKLLEVKLFGAVPLAGGNSCQAKQISKITLKSGKNFDPVVGGEINGTFAISDLNGCGLLNGLVSPLTAGGGNTIKATLKPTI